MIDKSDRSVAETVVIDKHDISRDSRDRQAVSL